MVEKLIRNGEVAVIVSPEYGAGWSSWNKEVNPMDKRYVELILQGNILEAKELAKKEGFYNGGLDNAIIVWVPEGWLFYITDTEGAEELHYIDAPTKIYTA